MLKIISYKLYILIFLYLYLFCYNSKANQTINRKLSHASIYIEYGQVGKALEILNSIKSSKDNNFKLLISYGRAFLKLREFEKAKKYFEDAIFSSEIEDEEAYLGIAYAYLEIGKFKKAYQNIRPLLKSSFKPVQTELILIEIELKTGYSDNAKKRLVKLLNDRKNDPNVIIAYAKQLFLNEDPYDAITYLEGEIIKNNNSPKVLVYLGRIRGVMGYKKQEKELYLKAAELYRKIGYELRAKILLESANKINFLDKRNENVSSDIINTPSEIGKEDKENNKDLVNKNNNFTNEKIEKRSIEETIEPLNINISNNLSSKSFDISWLPKSSSNKNFVPFKTKDIFFGSGFLIDDGNYVITNYHVIEGTSIVLIRTGIGKESAAEIAYYDKKKDLAVLKLINKLGKKNEFFSISNFEDPKPGSDALVIGYPMPDFFGASLPTITEGIVAKTTGLGDNPNNFLITSKINSGNSGGPIINKKGCLIGIAVGKLDTKAILKKLDMLPEDMNIGIKSSNASKILGSIKNNTCKLKKDFNRVTLYELMLPKVVFIIAGN
ncbi:MAG: Serine protease Do-like HtrA [Alphaproteobacteria bacterium MarineAlpha9_Bin4]|nr:MAG: Serine protease Do-like HtrA [Alphaproteobacteria bacterium MarineAlpha9_Bin4]